VHEVQVEPSLEPIDIVFPRDREGYAMAYWRDLPKSAEDVYTAKMYPKAFAFVRAIGADTRRTWADTLRSWSPPAAFDIGRAMARKPGFRVLRKGDDLLVEPSHTFACNRESYVKFETGKVGLCALWAPDRSTMLDYVATKPNWVSQWTDDELYVRAEDEPILAPEDLVTWTLSTTMFGDIKFKAASSESAVLYLTEAPGYDVFAIDRDLWIDGAWAATEPGDHDPTVPVGVSYYQATLSTQFGDWILKAGDEYVLKDYVDTIAEPGLVTVGLSLETKPEITVQVP